MKKITSIKYLIGIIVVFMMLMGHQVRCQSRQTVHPTTFRIKFEPKLEATLQQLPAKMYATKGASSARTGIRDIDAISRRYEVPRIRRMYPDAGKFEAKHRKHGLHLWYEVDITQKHSKQINEIVKAYKSSASIQAAECIYMATIDAMGPMEGPTNDPQYEDQWHYNNTGQSGGTGDADIDLPEAWEIEAGDRSVIVAIIDGGVDFNHPDLRDAMWENLPELNGIAGVDDDNNGYVDDIHGYNFVGQNAIIPAGSHGTHVAGTVGAVNNNGIGVSGVAGGSGNGDGVRLMSCGTFDNTGRGGGHAQALVYAADNGAVIAQNSWGYRDPDLFPESVKDAIDYFIENAGYDADGDPYGPMQGGLVIFAAANNNSSDDYFPGRYDKVLSVAAVDHKDKKSGFSNYGDWVDIAAPGSGILSTVPDNNYNYNSGTSMACPHVSGVAGLIISKFGTIGYTPDKVWQSLINSVDPIEEQNPDYIGQLGAGRLNAFKALLVTDDITFEPVTDLAVEDTGTISVTLNWTSTITGTASTAFGYNDIRYATFPITEANFEQAEKYISNHTAAPEGELDMITISGLTPNTTYYFAIKAASFAGFKSGLSNVVSSLTLPAPILSVAPASVFQQLDAGEIATQQITVQNIGQEDLIVNLKAKTRAPAATASLTTSPLFTISATNGKDYIYKIDPSTGDITDAIEVSDVELFANGLAYDGVYLYFTKSRSYDTRIFKVDPNSHEIIDTIQPPEGYEFRGLACSGSSIFGVDVFKDEILEMDLETGEVIKTIALDIAAGDGITYAGSRGTLFVSPQNGNSIHEVDIDTGEIISAIISPGRTHGLGYSEADQLLYVGNRGSVFGNKKIDAVNPNNGKIMFTLDLPYIQGIASDEAFNADWLSYTSEEQTVPPGGNTTFTITIDAQNTPPNTYHQYLTIESNAPLSPKKRVQVTLYVPGSPQIYVEENTIDVGTVFINRDTVSKSVTLYNTGSDALHIDNILLDSSEFYLGDISFPITIPRKDSFSFEVYFSAESEGLKSADLIVQSDSPDPSDLTIRLEGEALVPPALEVSKDNIQIVLHQGASATDTFSIGNNGGSDLKFHLSLLSTSKEVVFEEELLAGVSVLMTKDNRPKFTADLEAQGATVMVNEGPLTEATLMDIDLLLVESNYVPTATEIDIIRNWVTQGGNLFVDQRFNQEIYNTLLAGTGISLTQELAEYGITSDITPHAVTDGLEAYNINPGGKAGLAVSGNALTLIKDSKGLNHVAVGNLGEGKVLVIAYSSTEKFIYPSTGHSKLAMNAVNWMTDRSGISTSVATGVIAAGEQLAVEVLFDAAALQAGTYQNRLYITTNDPETPSGQIQTSLEVVVEGPSVRLSDNTIDFGGYPIDETISKTISIANVGTETLVVDALNFTDDHFFTADTAFQLAPDEQRVLTVSYTPNNEENNTGTLSIHSNDVANSPIEVQLSGEGLGGPYTSVSKTAIDFGPSELNASYVVPLVVTNLGVAPLVIDSFFTDNPRFTVNPTQLTLGPKEEGIVEVSYRPEAIENDEGILQWTSNDPYETVSQVSLTGSGIPAKISIAPEAINVTVAQGETLVQKAEIDNSRRFQDLNYTTAITRTQNFSGKHIFFKIANYTTFRDILESRGAITYESQNISRNTLETMDVLVINNGVYAAEQNIIREWVLEGGNLIIEGDFSRDRFNTILEGSGISYIDQPVSRGLTNDITQHPVTNGVGEYMITNNTRSILEVVAPGTSLVKDIEGSSFIAAASLGAGKVVAIASLNGHNVYIDETGHLDLGLNAMAWLTDAETGADWVQVTPSGNIGAQQTGEIDVTFNASAKEVGIYGGNLVVSTDDPLVTNVTIPLQLTVTEGTPMPNIAVDRTAFEFGEIAVNSTATDSLVIANTGATLLEIDALFTTDAHFSVSSTSLVLNPGQSETVFVSYTPDATEVNNGSLMIQSNDPDQSEITISLQGSGFVPTIIISPDNLSVELPQGETDMREITIDNSQRSVPLNFETTIQYSDTNTTPEHDFTGKKILFKSLRTEFRDILESKGAITSYTSDIIWEGRGDLDDIDVLVTHNGTYPQEADYIREWVLNGGNLIIEADFQRERFNTILGGSGITYLDQSLVTGMTGEITEHPVTEGVDQYMISTRFGYRSVLDVAAPAISLIRDAAGTSYMAISSLGLGKVVVIIGPNSADATLNEEGHLDLALNSMSWLIGTAPEPDWMQLSVASGQVPAGETMNISTMFNTTNLAVGAYAASLSINTDDVITPMVAIPVSLSVVAAASTISFTESENETEGQQLYKNLQNYQVFPNPFEDRVTIGFDLKESGYAHLKVIDVFGREVKTLLDGDQKSGTYNIPWDGNTTSGDQVANGMYILLFQSGTQTFSSRIFFNR